MGLPADITVIDKEQREALVARCAVELHYRGTKSDLIDVLKAGPIVKPGDELQINRGFSDAEQVNIKYYQLTYSNGVIDYDTILYFGSMLAEEMETAKPPPYFQFDYLLVDEFQDCTDLDMKIYMGLPFQNRFMVGDPDQSIFKFRGGNVDNILRMVGDVEWDKFYLQSNYRSGKNICRVAQHLIEENRFRAQKQTVSTVDFDGTVQVVVPSFRTPAEEMGSIVHQISQVAHDGPSIAILCRTNPLVDQFCAALVAAGIPVRRRNKMDLPSDWSTAKRFISWLATPDNDLLAFEFIRWSRNEKAALDAKLAALEAFKSINEFMFHIPHGITIDRVPQLMGKAGLGDASISKVRDVIGGMDQASDLRDLLLALNDWSVYEETIGDGVSVMTLHSAKGQEFDWVFLPAWEEGILPIRQAGENTRMIEEERRLAYVGITRARTRVTITSSSVRASKYDKEPQPASCSRFLLRVQQYLDPV